MSEANLQKQAERKRDQRMDNAFGLGSEDQQFEGKRMKRVAEVQQELVNYADQSVHDFNQRQSVLAKKSDRKEALPIINIALRHSNQHGLDQNDPLAKLLLKNPQLERLFWELSVSPLSFDTTGWSDVLKESSDTELAKSTDKAFINHYLRVWKAPQPVALRVLDQWAIRYPVDWVHIQLKKDAIKAMRNDTSTITFLYAGATIATSAAKRSKGDIATAREVSQSKLSHFLQVIAGNADVSLTCYEITPLRVRLKTNPEFEDTPSNLWFLNGALWSIERSLIAVISRELGLNSAFGGKLADWKLSEEVKSAVHAAKKFRPSVPESMSEDDDKSLSEDVLKQKRNLLKEHFQNSREFARRTGQIPVSNHATETTTQEAGLFNLLPDRTSLLLNVGKDIPLRDAFGQASWYNEVAGTSPRTWILATEEASRRIRKRERNQEISRKLGEEEITYLHGAYLNFWAVCIRHSMVFIFHLLFLRALYIIRPRVILCASDKVSTILRRGHKGPLPPLVESLITNLSVSVDTLVSKVDSFAYLANEWEWTDCSDGKFLSCWLGRIEVVQYAGCWSVMLIRFDTGYGAYRPELQRMLFELNVLLAIMLNIINWHASQYKVWTDRAARAVAFDAEACCISSGLRALFEGKRREFLFVQSRLQKLSGRSQRTIEEGKDEFVTRLNVFQLKGAAMAAIRRNTLDRALIALGEPESERRETQLQLLLEEGATLPSPPRMECGGDDWIEWFLSRKEGCNLVESARALVTDYDTNVKMVVNARAHIDWQKKRKSGPYPGYSGKTKPIEVFLWLCDVNTFTFDRLAASSKGHMLVTCKTCKLQGITDNDQNTHFCQDIDGQFGPGQTIRQCTEKFLITRLLIPAQLLATSFKDEIMTSEFEIQASRLLIDHLLQRVD